MFKPYNITQIGQEVLRLPKSDLIDQITQKLSQLPSTSKSNININTIDENSQSTPLEESSSDNHDTNQINKVYTKRKNWKNAPTRTYYPRPTPPDLLYEERPKFTSGMYSDDSIYEWNIDGKSEYEIMNLLQEIGMAATAFKAHKATDHEAAKLVVSGFTGS